MSEAVTALSFRIKQASSVAQDLRQGGFIAFGSGGHDSDNQSLPVDASASGLKQEFARIRIKAVWQDDELSLTAEATITSAEMAGRPLSESAVLDSDGDPILLKNFAPKYADEFESDEAYSIKLTQRF